jgi:phosphoribosylformylglycinamidine synthase
MDERGNVAGLMPHPERAVDRLLGSDDGMLLLRSLVESAAVGQGVAA